MTRILIVDDSALFRKRIAEALTGQPGIEVVGTAANGRLALNKFNESAVDVAIVDLEMPEMNGLELLDEMKRLKSVVKTIVFASATKSSALASLKALNRGAFDFVLKPTGDSESETSSVAEVIRNLLLPKIQLAVGQAIVPPIKVVAPRWPKVDVETFRPRAVVIASSTGGPNALEALFSNFAVVPEIPILLVQHMPPVFTAALAERLNALLGVTSTEAADGEPVKPGRLFVAPGDFHMRVVSEAGVVQIRLTQTPKRQSVRPCANELFESAAATYGKGLLAIVLTGMGEDGREGAIRVKESGGAVITQEGSSCAVNGMPRSVVEAGACDSILSLARIRAILQRTGKAQ